MLNPELVKGPWSKEEDKVMIELVDRIGPKKLSTIAQHLPRRIGPWSKEEDEVMIERVDRIGPKKLSTIVQHLPGRI
ncbi:hypothetical protein RYX36_011443, partial [Vicia faba]